MEAHRVKHYLPQRIQLRRTAGWRMPENTLKVDRTTRWGNPYPANGDAEAAVKSFRLWLANCIPGQWLADRARAELRGKNLACWCPIGTACHADVLLEIANQ